MIPSPVGAKSKRLGRSLRSRRQIEKEHAAALRIGLPTRGGAHPLRQDAHDIEPGELGSAAVGSALSRANFPNSRSASSGAMPGPRSLTEIRTPASRASAFSAVDPNGEYLMALESSTIRTRGRCDVMAGNWHGSSLPVKTTAYA